MSEIHLECHDLLHLLSDYLDGELQAELSAAIEHHMAECGHCRVVVDTLRKTISLYHELSTEPLVLPAEVRERLFHTLQLTLPEEQR